jgi:mono/diheme cytochrome c family protein
MLLSNAVIIFALVGMAAAQTGNHGAVPYTPPTAGAEMYSAHCASCHGKDAKGDGPAAGALKVPPPDLTTLAKQNHGRFPAVRVYQVIQAGGSIAAHGSKDMPMWGPIFRSLGHQDQAQAEARIRNLVHYLETLQTK